MKKSSADHDNVKFMPTSTVVLQTSLGNMCFDLAGAQFPLLTAQFVNFARSKYWNSVLVREVIPDIAAFFAHDTDSYIHHMFTNVEEQKSKEEGNYNNVKEKHDDNDNITKSLTTTMMMMMMMSPLPLNFYALYERAMKWNNSTCQERNDNNNINNSEELNLLTSNEQRQCIREEVYKSKKHIVSALHARISHSAHSTNLIVSKDERPAVRVGSSNNNNVNNSNSKLLTSPFHINRAGLLLVEVTSALTTLHTRTDANMEMKESEWHYTCKFAITLSNNRNMDFLTNKNYIVIGAISESDKTHAESWQTLKKIRLCPLTSEANVEMQSSVSSEYHKYKVMRSIVHYNLPDHANEQNKTHSSSSPPISENSSKHECFPRPIRAIRVVHVYVLPTLGAERYVHSSKMLKSKHNANQTLHNTSSLAAYNTNTLQTSVVARSLEDAGCFRYWANNSAIKHVNAYLTHLVDVQTQFIESTIDKAEKKNMLTKKHLHQDSISVKNDLRSVANVVITPNNSCIKCGSTYKSIIRLPEAKNDKMNIHSNNDGEELSDSDSVISFEVLDPNLVDEYNNSINTLSSSLLEIDQNDKSKEAIQHYNNNSGLSSVVTSSNTYNNIDNKSRDQRIDDSLSLMMNLLDGITDLTIRPAPNVLFVCKLNPITDEAGLQICFNQFGAIKGINVIRDKHTQRSLCYAFIEFDSIDSCAAAFQKMNNVLIDDFRIKVDFSQSVSKVWRDKQRERNKRVRSW